MKTILQQLVDLGREQGLTQAELAKKAGIHPVTLSRALETDAVTLATVKAVAAQLGYRLTLVPDNALAEGLAKGDLF